MLWAVKFQTLEMLRRVVTIHWIIALALLLPRSGMAQLPDAPSYVKFGSKLDPSGAPARSEIYSDAASGCREENSAGFNADRSTPPFFLALAVPVDAVPQESLYTPPKTRMGPGLSAATAAARPIPGAAVSLHNACPQNACSAAESQMCCGNAPAPFEHYLKNPLVVPITPRDDLRSAVKDIIDPFNLMTIAADSAFGIATNSHTPYGPGFMGITKYAGVSMTEDLTGEFFGTFLVPSLTHQDPHYHREPYASLPRRVLHTITQVVWTQNNTGRPMLNYANLVGGVATAIVSNTFVPGPGRQGFINTSQRLAIAFATSPSGNMITEFVPDLASHINFRVVIFQRILNSVANEEGGPP